MIWLGDYQSSLPKINRNRLKKDEKINHLPYYRFIYSDKHFVWSINTKKFLEKCFLIRQSIINNNKPINLINLKKFNLKRNNIFIFDTWPKSKHLFARSDDYTSLSTIKNFIEDITKEMNKISNESFKLFVKTKHYNLKQTKHKTDYINFLIQLEKKNKMLKILNSSDDYLKYLNSSKLCICYPFTSASAISKFYKIKTFYYDPTGTLINNSFDKKIKLIKSKKELRRIIKKNFN